MEHSSDPVIMDVIKKYRFDGLTCTGKIKKNHPELKIIIAALTEES